MSGLVFFKQGVDVIILFYSGVIIGQIFNFQDGMKVVRIELRFFDFRRFFFFNRFEVIIRWIQGQNLIRLRVIVVFVYKRVLKDQSQIKV